MKLLKGGHGAPGNAETGRSIPLPVDGPLMSIEEAGTYLRLSAASVRKLIDGRADQKDDTLGALLRGWVVRLSPHRRYIRRRAFMAWLNGVAGSPNLDKAI
jgi:hypothetical protein